MSEEEIPVVVDANILFSALLRPGHRFRDVLASERRFYVSETLLAEIFRHKEKIVSATRLDQDELAGAYHDILSILELYRERLIPADCWEQARVLCRGVDPEDATTARRRCGVRVQPWFNPGLRSASQVRDGAGRGLRPPREAR